mgnify:CR=1 FL=1|tara:strand:+ start:161 stop:442 length:282 start_codon:yes stop_codon:yes gene_type:complete
MGLSVWNNELISHREQGTGNTDFRFRLHLGSQQIDTTSPTWSETEWQALKQAAAVGFSAFDTEASNIIGSWWTNLPATPTGAREGFWQVVQTT